MTPAEVRARVEQIRSVLDDDEKAHGREDRLRADVLEAIANGADDPAGLAREALATEHLDFSRWTA